MVNATDIKVKRTLLIKIAISILLVVVIGGIWAIKNAQKNETLIASNSSNVSSNIDSNLVLESNPDFALLVTKVIDLEKLKSYGIPIIIDFGADSCIPCKEMAPVLKQLNEELREKAIVRFVDVWKYQSLADGYPISVIPTQIFIDATGKPFNPKNKDILQLELFSNKITNEHIFTAHKGGLKKDQLLSALKEMGMK